MIDQIIVILGITFLVMLSPGPDLLIVTRNTLKGGRKAGLITALGILTSNLIHISYCALGIGLLISQSLLAFSLLRYAGAAYLIFLGYQSWRDAGKILEDNPVQQAALNRTWFAQGFLNNLLNVKGILFYLGVFTLVITPETSLAVMLLLILIMKSVSAGFWIAFIFTLDLQPVRDRFNRGQRFMQRLFGTLLIALGLRVAVEE